MRKLDQWQRDVLNYDGNILIAKGRRIGATWIMAIKAVEWIRNHVNHHPISQVVCVSLTEDQAELIIAFATEYARERYPYLIAGGRDMPTKTRLVLDVEGNKRILIARPASGSVRGFDAQIIMIDEAAYHDAPFWAAIKPMILTSNGRIWMWSTFDQKEGYFWDRFDEAYFKKEPKARFKVWHLPTPEVMDTREICDTWTEEQKTAALQAIEDDRREMSPAEFAREYLAMPQDDISRWFSDEIIDEMCTLPVDHRIEVTKTYGGFDIGRMEDPSAFMFVGKINKDELIQVYDEELKEGDLMRTADHIAELHARFKSKSLGMDTGGLGWGVYDALLRNPKTWTKIKSLNNANLALDVDDEQHRKLLKEEMYTIMLRLAQQKKIKLFDTKEIRDSLRAVQFDYIKKAGAEPRLKIIVSPHARSHRIEALVRAVYMAHLDKGLRLFATFSGSRKTF